MQLNYFLKKENMAVGMGTIVKDVSEEKFSKLKQKTRNLGMETQRPYLFPGKTDENRTHLDSW